MLCRVKNFRFELDASREVDRLQKLWGETRGVDFQLYLLHADDRVCVKHIKKI